MTNYSKFTLRTRLSDYPDFRQPTEDSAEADETGTPGEFLVYKGELVAATWLSVDMSSFTTATGLLVVNKSTTDGEDVTVRWWFKAGSRAAGNLTIANSNPDTFTDSDGGNLTTAPEFAAAGGWARITSSEGGGANDQAWPIQEINDDGATKDRFVTVNSPLYSATANLDDDTALIDFEQFNEQGIPPGEYLYVGDDLSVAGDVQLYIAAGTPRVEVYVVGS